jgi:hypothetical protein
MLAPAVRVYARLEANIGTVISGYDRLGVVTEEFGWYRAGVLRGAEFILLVTQSRKSIGRIYGGSATARSGPVWGMVGTEAHGGRMDREWIMFK